MHVASLKDQSNGWLARADTDENGDAGCRYYKLQVAGEHETSEGLRRPPRSGATTPARR